MRNCHNPAFGSKDMIRLNISMHLKVQHFVTTSCCSSSVPSFYGSKLRIVNTFFIHTDTIQLLSQPIKRNMIGNSLTIAKIVSLLSIMTHSSHHWRLFKRWPTSIIQKYWVLLFNNFQGYIPTTSISAQFYKRETNK